LNENSKILDEAFEQLFEYGLVNNQVQFSENWMLKSGHYYSMIKASGRKPSVSALGALAARLKSHHEVLKNSRSGDLRYQAELITPLLRRVWTALYESSLSQK